MRRSGRINILSLLLLLALVAGGGACWLFGPYYWDFEVMKEITKSSAREWSALGELKGRAELTHLLAKRELDDYITERDCTFEERGSMKIIDCRWVVEVPYPYTSHTQVLDFSLTTQIDARGDVTQF